MTIIQKQSFVKNETFLFISPPLVTMEKTFFDFFIKKKFLFVME